MAGWLQEILDQFGLSASTPMHHAAALRLAREALHELRRIRRLIQSVVRSPLVHDWGIRAAAHDKGTPTSTEGTVMSNDITAVPGLNQDVTITLAPANAAGQPLKPTVSWSSGTPNLAAITPSPDGLSCEVVLDPAADLDIVISMSQAGNAVTGAVHIKRSAGPPPDLNVADWGITATVHDKGGTVTSTALPAGTVGAAYTASLTPPTTGTSPYTYVVTSGALPGGLSLLGSFVSGTPASAGTYAFAVTPTDSAGAAQPVQNYTLTVS